MSDHERSGAVMERELAAIDEALDAGAARHADPLTRELQELALALRADAPEAAEPFAAELRGRLEAGFPPPPTSLRARLRGLRPPPARKLLPALGTTALILLPLVVIVLGTSGVLSVSDQDDAGGAGGGGGGVSAPALESSDLAAPPGGGFEPGQRERRIERAISLELETPVDEMARVADGVTTVTNRYGGFVLSSSVSTGRDGAGGDFELRIPSDRLRPALRDLSELATVRSQNQSGRDVTRDVVPHATASRRPAPSAAACCAGSRTRTPTKRPRRSARGSTSWPARSTAFAASSATCGFAPTTRWSG